MSFEEANKWSGMIKQKDTDENSGWVLVLALCTVCGKALSYEKNVCAERPFPWANKRECKSLIRSEMNEFNANVVAEHPKDLK